MAIAWLVFALLGAAAAVPGTDCGASCPVAVTDPVLLQIGSAALAKNQKGKESPIETDAPSVQDDDLDAAHPAIAKPEAVTTVAGEHHNHHRHRYHHNAAAIEASNEIITKAEENLHHKQLAAVRNKWYPQGDSDCEWDYLKVPGECKHKIYCEYRFEFGDFHFSQSCRLRTTPQFQSDFDCQAYCDDAEFCAKWCVRRDKGQQCCKLKNKDLFWAAREGSAEAATDILTEKPEDTRGAVAMYTKTRIASTSDEMTLNMAVDAKMSGVPYGETALHVAANKGHFGVLSAILSAVPSRGRCEEKRWQCLADREEVAGVKYDGLEESDQGKTALRLAIERGYPKSVDAITKEVPEAAEKEEKDQLLEQLLGELRASWRGAWRAETTETERMAVDFDGLEDGFVQLKRTEGMEGITDARWLYELAWVQQLVRNQLLHQSQNTWSG